MVIRESSSQVPLEGYFWYINGQIVGVYSEVPKYNYTYQLSGKTHPSTWNKIADDYLVDGHKVDYDYYPRGRVMVSPELDSQGRFKRYSCQIFADICLDDEEVKDKIVDAYNLYYVDDIDWFISDKYSAMNHYTCHRCRGDA